MHYVLRYDLESVEIECLWFELCFHKSKHFLIGVMYQPLDSSKHVAKDYNNYLLNHLTTVDAENKECTVLGD